MLMNTESKVVYAGDGSLTTFPFSFTVWDTDQIAVTVTDAIDDSVDTTTASISVELASAGGGILTFTLNNNPLPEGYKIAITRDMPFTQGVSLVAGGRLDPAVLETRMDQDAAERQQLLEGLNRAILIGATSSETAEDFVLSLFAARTEAATSESNAATSESNAATSESNAATSETAAENSAITAQAWAMAASEAVPIASANIAGKAKTSASWEVDPDTGVATVPAATTSLAGIARQATDAEASAGEEDGAYVTPVHIKNAIDACRASDDEIAEGTSTTKFPSVAHLSTAVGWGMPDYINSVDYTDGTSFEYDGYIIIYTLVGNASSVSHITVTIYKGDAVARVSQVLNYADGADGTLSILPLPKGYNMVFVSNNTATATIPSLQFCPCIGVNYASEN